MKSILLTTMAGLILLSTSCTRESVSNDNNPNIIATSGTWRVSLFSERGKDETADFAGYSFSFNANGNLEATRNGTTQQGTWSTGSGRFYIDLGPKTDTNKPLGELTDDWVILSSTATEIRLTDDNVTSEEFLTFSRN